MNGENRKRSAKNNIDSSGISKTTAMRLPYYLRTLRGLLENNVYRTSSTELAKLMNMTPSRIRQDMSALGVNGLKGYGYDVKTLYTSILDIAGIREEFSAVILGTKEMISMLCARPVFIRQGVALKKTFETSSPSVIDEFEEYCKASPIDIVVLATENEYTQSALAALGRLNVKGVWNFSDTKLKLHIPVKNIWIDDSLTSLCFELNQMDKK